MCICYSPWQHNAISHHYKTTAPTTAGRDVRTFAIFCILYAIANGKTFSADKHVFTQ